MWAAPHILAKWTGYGVKFPIVPKGTALGSRSVWLTSGFDEPHGSFGTNPDQLEPTRLICEASAVYSTEFSANDAPL